MNLDFLYTAVSWVLLRWHQLFTAIGLDPKGGLNWSLSIVFLVITARLLLFRFFVKQVHYQRRMQEMQPKIKKLQEKHKGDKATLQREMMALQQAEGFNPITGCLPMFLQIPVFISLFHVLKHLANATQPGYDPKNLTLYTFTSEQTLNGAHSKLFGAPLAASLHDSATQILTLGGDVDATRIVTIILVIVSALATFITQRAVIANQTTPAEGQAALIQKLMLVGIPISVVFSGFIFPLGVLLYWFTSNLWTMGQQFYIHRFHPHTPGGTAAVAAPTGELGKSLAPKVGAKPVNPKSSRGTAAQSPTDAIPVDGVDTTESKDDSAPGGTSRPVNRGQRPGGGRPANKRSTPSKKRR
jgi:YidC/Oxa1 family membrane protein insertase